MHLIYLSSVCLIRLSQACYDLYTICRPACWALMETKTTIVLSLACPPVVPHSVLVLFLGLAVHQKKKEKKRTVPSLFLTANYFWPTYPDRKSWQFFSPSFFFCFFYPPTLSCVFFLHVALLFLFFLVKKKINWKEGSNGSCKLVHIPWQHVIFKSVRLYSVLLFVLVYLLGRNIKDEAIKRHKRKVNTYWKAKNCMPLSVHTTPKISCCKFTAEDPAHHCHSVKQKRHFTPRWSSQQFTRQCH